MQPLGGVSSRSGLCYPRDWPARFTERCYVDGRAKSLVVGLAYASCECRIRCLNGECVARARALASITLKDSYLVDPASSHMLVSKIKPCMSKYKYCTAKLQTAH